jgi:hypothetical protein
MTPYVHENGLGTLKDNEMMEDDLRGNTNGPWKLDPLCEARVKRSGNIG